jgi:hypothetical protein
VELAIVDQTTGLVDYEEREDDPTLCQTTRYGSWSYVRTWLIVGYPDRGGGGELEAENCSVACRMHEPAVFTVCFLYNGDSAKRRQ